MKTPHTHELAASTPAFNLIKYRSHSEALPLLPLGVRSLRKKIVSHDVV